MQHTPRLTLHIETAEREFLHSIDNHPHSRRNDCDRAEEERREKKVKLELSEL